MCCDDDMFKILTFAWRLAANNSNSAVVVAFAHNIFIF